MSDMAGVILRTSRLDLLDSLALARELTAAGFGSVAEAKAGALEEAAEATNVNDENGLNAPEEIERRGYMQRHSRMSVARWLRARAAAVRGEK